MQRLPSPAQLTYNTAMMIVKTKILSQTENGSSLRDQIIWCFHCLSWRRCHSRQMILCICCDVTFRLKPKKTVALSPMITLPCWSIQTRLCKQSHIFSLEYLQIFCCKTQKYRMRFCVGEVFKKMKMYAVTLKHDVWLLNTGCRFKLLGLCLSSLLCCMFFWSAQLRFAALTALLSFLSGTADLTLFWHQKIPGGLGSRWVLDE